MTEQELAQKFEENNITLASIPKRMIAFFIDELIASVFIFIIFYDLLNSISTEDDIVYVINYLTPYVLALKIAYQTFFVWMYGATPGKMVVKIKVIYMYTIENPNIMLSVIRACVRLISETFFYVGFIWAFFNPKKQTWQDYAAKTLVVNA
ncbi:MAG: RDD family protein [Campylobacteraceae bacterium]